MTAEKEGADAEVPPTGITLPPLTTWKWMSPRAETSGVARPEALKAQASGIFTPEPRYI